MEKCVSIDFEFSSVRVRRVAFSVSHFCDGSAGLSYSSFGYALKGSTEIECDGITLDIPEGSFFYLPAGVRYRSHWSGAPEIEYYMLHLKSAKKDIQLYRPARIDALSNADTLDKILEIESGGTIAAMRLYELAAASLPYLEKQDLTRSETVRAAARFIRAHYNENYSTARLAAYCCLSESRLYHVFRNEMGVSPLEYRNEIRIERAAEMLRERENSLDEILFATGFSSDIYFREVFKKIMGLTPTEYRKQNKK